ncbi:TPA: tRNA-binding protein [Candidatus Bipolaricaulota bacterium]|nr:tRNA-binding protein [Candidatus Bipolaricaulota bacterium]
MATQEDFRRLEIRVGTIVEAQPFPDARKPAYRLKVDFGPELGVKRSSAQITDLYRPEELVGKQVLAVVNFPPKRIAGFLSEVLVLGVDDDQGRVVLVAPDRPVPDGRRLY